MNYLKTLGKSLAYVFSLILILTIFISLFSYFNIFNDTLTKFLKLLIPIISILIGAFILGKQSNKKGYLEGLKLGLITTIILIILSLLFKNIKGTSFIYYCILVITSLLGSMIGINTKQEKK